MLITLQEILQKAEQGNFAIGAFNSPTLESARAVIEAAEELDVPVILQHAEVHFEINPLEVMGPILIDLANKASVPVTVHLDHGTSISTVRKAIELGFSSVMIDASDKPFSENVNIVKEVVDYAHTNHVSVEAELGIMSSSGIGGEETIADDEITEQSKGFTDPLVAKDFVERTNIDALAASFGTVHGIYIKEPALDIPRLKEIYKAIGIPVVMHGGSGLSKEDYLKTINSGVRKINYYSYAAKAGAEAVRDYINNNDSAYLYHDLTMVAKDAMKEDIKRVMRIFSNKE